MKLVRITIIVASLALAASACGKKNDDGKKKEPAAKVTDRTPADKPPEAKPISSEDFAKKIQNCWAAVDAKDEAKFAACYGEKSVHEMADFTPPMSATGPKGAVESIKPFWTAFPDIKHPLELVLVNGHNAVIVYVAQATNTGEFMGAPPTGKKISMRSAQYLTAQPDGTRIRDTIYLDQGVLAFQLGLSPQPAGTMVEEIADTQVIFAANDDKEKANLAASAAGGEAFNAHDVDKVMAMYADDAIFNWNSSPEGPTKGKKAIMKGLTDYYAMSSDVKGETVNTWAAGDYVAAEVVSSGTHDGDGMGMKATNKKFKLRELHVTKFADGKITELHIFANSMAWAVQLGMMDQGGGDKPKQ